MNKGIRFLGKKIKGDKLLSFFGVYSIGKILSILSGLVLLPLFTQKIPQEEFGIIGLLWIINPILTRLMNLGTDAIVSIKYFKLDKKELSNYVYHSLLITFLSAIVIWILLNMNSNWAEILVHDSFDFQSVTLLLIYCLATTLLSMMKSFLQLSGKAMLNVLVTIAPSIMISVITFYLIIEVSPSYHSYLLGMVIGNGFFALLAIVYFFKKFPIRYFTFSFEITRTLLKLGLPILPGTLATLTLASSDRYVIKYFMDLEAVAVYVYGYRFAEYVLNGIFQPFQQAISPILLQKAAHNFKEATIYSKKTIDFILPIIVMILAIIVVPFNDLMVFFSNNQYEEAFLIFLIALMGILFNNVSDIYSVLFNHLERMDLNVLLAFSCAIINLTLTMWLVPIYGIVSAAVSTVISFLVVLFLSIQLLNRFVHIKFNFLRILFSIIPFSIYLTFIYFLSINHLSFPLYIVYMLKVTLLIVFCVITYLISTELRVLGRSFFSSEKKIF